MHNYHSTYYRNDPTEKPLPWPMAILLSIPVLFIILLTVFGNILVLCFKAKVGRTNTTLLVWNLGLTDFLVGVFVLPMGGIHLIMGRWAFGRTLCRIWIGADVTFCTCSVVTICIISVDRYLAVSCPLSYKTVMTKFKVVTTIIFIWCFSSGILLATVRWEDKSANKNICFAGNEIRYLAHSVVFAFFLPASVTLTLYWRIYNLARNRQRALDRGFFMILGQNMSFLTTTLSQATLRVHVGKNNGLVEHQRRVLRTHERIAKTLGVVSGSFLFCWLPFFTLYLTNYHCSGCISTFVIEIASWLGYCNSMLNPIIYSFTVKEFKRSAYRLLLPFWQCLYNKCPSLIRKPPNARETMRIVRHQKHLSKIKMKKKSSPLSERVVCETPESVAKIHSKSSAIKKKAIDPILLESNTNSKDLGSKTNYFGFSSISSEVREPNRSSSFFGKELFEKSTTGKNKKDEEIDIDGLAKEDGVVTTTFLIATSSNMFLNDMPSSAADSANTIREPSIRSDCGGWHRHLSYGASATSTNFALSNRLENEKMTYESIFRKTNRHSFSSTLALKSMRPEFKKVKASLVEIDGDKCCLLSQKTDTEICELCRRKDDINNHAKKHRPQKPFERLKILNKDFH